MALAASLLPFAASARICRESDGPAGAARAQAAPTRPPQLNLRAIDAVREPDGSTTITNSLDADGGAPAPYDPSAALLGSSDTDPGGECNVTELHGWQSWDYWIKEGITPACWQAIADCADQNAHHHHHGKCNIPPECNDFGFYMCWAYNLNVTSTWLDADCAKKSDSSNISDAGCTGTERRRPRGPGWKHFHKGGNVDKKIGDLSKCTRCKMCSGNRH